VEAEGGVLLAAQEVMQGWIDVAEGGMVLGEE
jgi:hypothetical protein